MNHKCFATPTWTSAAILALGALACSDSNGNGRLSLSLSARRAPGATLVASATGGVATPAVVAAGDSTVITLGNDTLILKSIQVVLRKVELKRVETTACDAVADNGDCEEFEAGPVLASFPLGTTNTVAAVTVDAPAGQYDELEFEIHKPTDDPSDAAFLAANPAFNGVSIKVTGTFSKAGVRSSFTFTSDLDASEEVELSPPLSVAEGAGANLTVRLDVATWFVNGGALIDPASANKRGLNEGVVKGNIERSIDAFEDENHDGSDDHHEGS